MTACRVPSPSAGAATSGCPARSCSRLPRSTRTCSQQLENYGLIKPRAGTAHYDGDALVIAKTAAELSEFGFEPRHLRTFKNAADREVGLVEQVVAPMRGSRDAGASARADDAVNEIAALSVKLHATLVKSGLRTS